MGPFEVATTLGIGFFVMLTTISVGVPIAKALARRMDQRAGQPRIPSEVMARLERMEQAIDSVAVEVERISEGQRFTTKLLSERANGQTASAHEARSGVMSDTRGGGQ